jgi:hypothetical protein
MTDRPKIDAADVEEFRANWREAVTFTGVDNRGALQFTPKELAAHDRNVRRETAYQVCKLIREDLDMLHEQRAYSWHDVEDALAAAIRSLLDGQEEGNAPRPRC